MNALKDWVLRSRKEQERAPERYLASHPDLIMDETSVLMTQEKLRQLEHNCGRYEGTWPTGEYLGKMFLRGQYLYWFTISRENPMTHTALQSRKIEVI